MTNWEYLTQKENIRKLAEKFIQLRSEESIDYDYDESPYLSGTDYWYECSDGADFGYPIADGESLNEAIEHEIKWLLKEKNNESIHN